MSSELPFMYLKGLVVENAGPIPDLRFYLPFRDDVPIPLVLVGPNGSGKSTLLSFIVKHSGRVQTAGLRTGRGRTRSRLPHAVAEVHPARPAMVPRKTGVRRWVDARRMGSRSAAHGVRGRGQPAAERRRLEKDP